MALGEAFVEVRADLRPFGRDLRRAVRPIVEEFERELNRHVGTAFLSHTQESSRRIGDELSRGLKNSIVKQFREKNAFIAVAGALGSALDDGISALPTEVKAAIVLGILLALPIIGAMLTGVIVASIGAGVAGMGVLLASQFEEVQQEATFMFLKWRRDLAETARAFGPALLSALGMIDSRIEQMRDSFTEIFNVSAEFVEPLTRGLLDFIEAIVTSIRDNIGNMRPFIDELASGFEFLGSAIGTAIQILVNTGDDGVKALRDLFGVISVLIISTALLLSLFTKLYGALRQVTTFAAQVLGPLAGIAGPLAVIFEQLDKRSNANNSVLESNTDLMGSFEGLIAATKGETDALKQYITQLQEAADAVRSQLDLSIAWEESLDSITEALRRNGDTLDITTEKGRENVRAFLEGLDIAQERALERVATGEMTADQAVAQYQKEIEQLRALANQAGISNQEFDELYGSIILAAQARISAEEMGITALEGELDGSGDAAARLLNLLRSLKGVGFASKSERRGMQDGGIVSLPETINVAEAGPEVVIPLTKPGRAAQLLQESGLDAMLGSGGPSQILVFIGNEQLDSRMVRIVERASNQQALALNHGGRSL